jgi:formylglycine-generating enzyme required for sulfatase activity
MLLDEGAKHRDESLIRLPEPEPAPSAPRPSVVALLGTVRDPQQPTPARVQAGFTLGEQGDPRFPVTLSEWWDELPRLRPGQSAGYFCRVPTGTYVIGDAGQDARDDEQPPYRVHQEHGFYIARYPITNAQWQAWVRVGGPPAGGADADGLNHPNQPVVGVGWDACRDFCNWLTQALMHVRNEREGRARASHVIVRLPSEAEWESAARGSKGLRYTWGNEWRPDRAASKDDQSTRGTAATVPVGCYPLGAAPCGALDMLGNIWEWTASPWTPSHAAQQAAKITDDAAQLTLKGGSYKTRPALIRCGARSSGSRDSRHPDLGFRVVVELR